MSSPTVRNAVMTDLKASFPALDMHDLSEYISIKDIPQNTTGVTLLIQFIGGSEDMVNISGEGNQGWQERGSIAMHFLIPSGFDFTPHLPEMERIRLSIRGKRLSDSVVIESASPFTDQISNAIRIDGGWHGWVSYLSFNRHVCG